MNSWDEIAPRVHDLIDGRLSAAEEREVLRVLEQNEEFARRYRELRMVVEGLADMREERAPIDLADRVLAAIDAGSGTPSRPAASSRPLRLVVRYGAIAASLLAVVVVGLLLMSERDQPLVREDAERDAAQVTAPEMIRSLTADAPGLLTEEEVAESLDADDGTVLERKQREEKPNLGGEPAGVEPARREKQAEGRSAGAKAAAEKKSGPGAAKDDQGDETLEQLALEAAALKVAAEPEAAGEEETESETELDDREDGLGGVSAGSRSRPRNGVRNEGAAAYRGRVEELRRQVLHLEELRGESLRRGSAGAKGPAAAPAPREGGRKGVADETPAELAERSKEEPAAESLDKGTATRVLLAFASALPEPKPDRKAANGREADPETGRWSSRDDGLLAASGAARRIGPPEFRDQYLARLPVGLRGALGPLLAEHADRVRIVEVEESALESFLTEVGRAGLRLDEFGRSRDKDGGLEGLTGVTGVTGRTWAELPLAPAAAEPDPSAAPATGATGFLTGTERAAPGAAAPNEPRRSVLVLILDA